MYHEKMGLMTDADGNVIAFSGSMNESGNAFSMNYEAFDVFLFLDRRTGTCDEKAVSFSGHMGRL